MDNTLFGRPLRIAAREIGTCEWYLGGDLDESVASGVNPRFLGWLRGRRKKTISGDMRRQRSTHVGV